jgi:Dolichyl-phosphate-mannose-protein mannosyltransferase
LSRSERILLAATAAVTAVLRGVLFFRYRFDADEQHHLHVAWGWTAGMVQYRDYFDNHAPLFHMLLAPVLALFPERSDILLIMRAPMLILFGIAVWATYDLTRRVYDGRVAAWAVVLLALFPPFFLKSLEFRTDNLWVALWMVALVGIVRGWKPFRIGLLLGAAFAVSLKTTLLLITLAVAGAITLLFLKRRLPVAGLLPFAAGFVVVPAVLAVYFVSAGAWDRLVYCTLTFNGNLALTRKNLWVGRAIFPFTFAAVVWAAWRFRNARNVWAYFFAVAIGVYSVTLAGFWILISPRDFLALMPLCAMFAAALLTARKLSATAIVIALCLISFWKYADRLENKTAWHTTMMDQALRLSHPGELVMDLKGETIYRHRPFYYAFEFITRSQLAHGILKDTVAADVARTRTYVAQADGPMWPPKARAFLSANFLNMGRLRAAGQWIQEDGSFTIAIPGEYVIVGPGGELRGVLDGTPYKGARQLAAGAHRFAGEKGAAVLWAPAFRRGHSPFHLRDLEF